MIKKLILAVLFVTVLLSLFACGNTGDETTDKSATDIDETSGQVTEVPIISEFVETDANHAHTYFEALIEPTCTSIGKKAIMCVCGDIKEVLEYLPMTDHQANKASCGVDSVCSVCNKVLVEKYDHVIKYVTVAEATCTSDGVKTAVCERCGYSDEIITPASHSYSKYLIDNGKASAVCVTCGNQSYDINVIQLHNEKESGVTYSNGKFTMGEVIYKLPEAVIGDDKAPYQVDFTFTLDSIINASNLKNGINGRNVLRYQGSMNSIIRAFPIDDGNGGYLSDVIEIGTLSNINISLEKYVKMKAGDSIKVSLWVKPMYGTVDIFINDEYVSTRAFDSDPITATDTKIYFGYGKNDAFKASVSNISIIQAAN